MPRQGAPEPPVQPHLEALCAQPCVSLHCMGCWRGALREAFRKQRKPGLPSRNPSVIPERGLGRPRGAEGSERGQARGGKEGKRAAKRYNRPRANGEHWGRVLRSLE